MPYTDPADVTIVPEVLVAAFDEEVVFTCIGFGIPMPTLAWARIDTDLPLIPPNFEETSYNMTNEEGYVVAILELKIVGTDRNDEGSYECEGRNNILNLIEAPTVAIGRFLIEGKQLWV